MGNVIKCEKINYECLDNPNDFLVLNLNQKEYNIPQNNSNPLNYLSNDYIDNNFFLKKSFQNYFIRNTKEIQNFEIKICPVIKLNIQQSERELDLNLIKCQSEIQSVSINKDVHKSLIYNNIEKNKGKNISKNSLQLIKRRRSLLNSTNNKNLFYAKDKNDKKNFIDDMAISENHDELSNYSINITNNIIFQRKNTGNSHLSNLDIISICQYSKGEILYKDKKYKYLGKRDSNKNKIGFGIIIWDDKSKLKGYFQNNKINGYAKFIDNDSLFSGIYKDDTPNGYGIYEKNNIIIEGGTWLNNHLNGIGIQMLGFNDYYQGEFKRSSKFGIGLYHWNDGTICLGEWKDDKMNGYGEISYSNNNSYIGEFKENMMDGWGEFYWNDGKYYCGQYKDNLKHGFGIYVSDFKKYECYIGFFEYGKTTGLGIKIKENDFKMAFWKDGKKINWVKYWEIKDYLKSSQLKFSNFFHKDIKYYKQYIKTLYRNDILSEKFNFKDIFQLS